MKKINRFQYRLKVVGTADTIGIAKQMSEYLIVSEWIENTAEVLLPKLAPSSLQAAGSQGNMSLALAIIRSSLFPGLELGYLKRFLFLSTSS